MKVVGHVLLAYPKNVSFPFFIRVVPMCHHLVFPYTRQRLEALGDV